MYCYLFAYSWGGCCYPHLGHCHTSAVSTAVPSVPSTPSVLSESALPASTRAPWLPSYAWQSSCAHDHTTQPWTAIYATTIVSGCKWVWIWTLSIDRSIDRSKIYFLMIYYYSKQSVCWMLQGLHRVLAEMHCTPTLSKWCQRSAELFCIFCSSE